MMQDFLTRIASRILTRPLYFAVAKLIQNFKTNIATASSFEPRYWEVGKSHAVAAAFHE